MKKLNTYLFGILIIISGSSHAAWTSEEGHKIKSLDSGIDGKFYVLLDGYTDANCAANGILIDINERDSHDSDDHSDSQSFDIMFTMLLSAFHSATMVRMDVDTYCRGSRVQMVN